MSILPYAEWEYDEENDCWTYHLELPYSEPIQSDELVFYEFNGEINE